MNTEALILFLILLLGLVLCSFLGGNCGKEGFEWGTSNSSKNRFNGNSNSSTNGSSTSSNVNYDNYNHYQGSSTQLASGTTYYGENGGSVVVNTNSDGTQNLQVVLDGGQSPITLTSPQSSSSAIEGFSSTIEGFTPTGPLFYGPNGETATIVETNYGEQYISVKLNNKTIILKPPKNYSGSKPPVYSGPNGETAVVVTTSNGLQGFRLKTSNGTILFKQSSSSSSSSSYNSNKNKSVYYGANGVVATVINTGNGQQIIRVKTPNGNYIFTQSGTYYNPNEISNTQYYGSTGSHIQQYNGAYTSQYYGPHGGSATTVTGRNGNSAYYAKGPNGNTVAGTTANNNNQNYYNTLPPGIPASQIPAGQEDLYILKSQVVPPVCPACPSASTIPRQEPCPPCEPCGRCPEPAFECKKVPNYNAIDNNYLPAPVLSDFSSFGM
jgi:hypothetical protein